MSNDELLQHRKGAILVATLNRPAARNALNRALVHQLGLALLDAEADPSVRAVVLTGAGDRAFCAGMDLQEFADGAPATEDRRGADGFQRFVSGDFPVPVVGAANATAVAGGFELLLACDIIVASSDAKFGLPEVKRGLLAAGGGTFLGTRIPLAVALEMTLTGDSIDAGRAHELGLVNAVTAPGEVLPAALEMAERISANGPLGVAATKELVRLGVTDATRARGRLAELTRSVFSSADAKEGAVAFIEKRAPVWQGR